MRLVPQRYVIFVIRHLGAISDVAIYVRTLGEEVQTASGTDLASTHTLRTILMGSAAVAVGICLMAAASAWSR